MYDDSRPHGDGASAGLISRSKVVRFHLLSLSLVSLPEEHRCYIPGRWFDSTTREIFFNPTPYNSIYADLIPQLPLYLFKRLALCLRHTSVREAIDATQKPAYNAKRYDMRTLAQSCQRLAVVDGSVKVTSRLNQKLTVTAMDRAVPRVRKGKTSGISSTTQWARSLSDSRIHRPSTR